MDATQAAKLVSISTAFLLSGYMTSASQNSLPLLYKQPARVSAPLFNGVYHRGAALVIPGTLVCAAAYAYLAWAVPSQRSIHAFSSCITFAILPMTMVVMMPGIKRLLHVSDDSAEQEKVDQSGEVLRLLKAWGVQNWWRASMTFAGAMAGLSTVVSDRSH